MVADRDNTVYETTMGLDEFSNGAGSYLFSGRTNLDAGFRLRRGLVRFDLSAIPPGSEIVAAEVTLYQSHVSPNAIPVSINLHRVLEEWGEGASDGIGPEGQGAPAQPGDATWFHRFYNTATWTDEGGTFTPTSSAATTVGMSLEDYVWACSSGLVSDIQAWVADSAANFGWIIIGNEDGAGTVRRFNSRSNTQAETQPRLRVVYRSADEVYTDGFESPLICD
jgi:hypothetical protein